MKFWLLTLTQNQEPRLAKLKTNLRKKKKNGNSSSKLKQKMNHLLQQKVEDYRTGDCLKEGTRTFILSLDQQKVWKKGRFYTSTKTAPHCPCWCFFHRNFHLLVGQTNLYYQQHLDRQAGPCCRLPDIMLLDMTTFIALALQIGHELKDTLHDYWSRLMAAHSHFTARPRHERDFYIYCIFCKM